VSFLRYARRADTTQPTIVDDLRSCGYTVIVIGKPVDVLVRHPTWPTNTWKLLELKTKNRKDGYKPRADQLEQAKFCEAQGVPYIFDTEMALTYLQGTNPK
jgi:hypothetical protein